VVPRWGKGNPLRQNERGGDVTFAGLGQFVREEGNLEKESRFIPAPEKEKKRHVFWKSGGERRELASHRKKKGKGWGNTNVIH